MRTDSGKQAISDLMEAVEDYLLEFIATARTMRSPLPELASKRDRLVDAIDNVRKAEEDNRL
jgi:hypothetical protein